MKSYETFLLGLFDALFKDIKAYYRGTKDQVELERDYTRLLSLVNTRGIDFLTVDLPAAGKHFDRCLSTGTYVPSKSPAMGSNKGQVIPRLFGGLLGKVFTPGSGRIRVNPELQAIFFLRQLYFVAKKVRITCNDTRTYKAVREFFEIEREIPIPYLDWDGDDLGDGNSIPIGLHRWNRDSQDPGPLFGPSIGTRLCDDDDQDSDPRIRRLLEVVQRVADTISVSLGELDPLNLNPKHGPGAVSDLRAGENKYSFPCWDQKLEATFPAEFFAFANTDAFLDWRSIGGEPGLKNHEPPSRLIAVPKTQKTVRLIASEPTAHQWIQQSVARALVRAIEGTPLNGAISFRDQTISQDLALQGSLHGGLATIDLSSASDRLSCKLVESVFRANQSWLRAFHACRTRWLVNTVDKKSPQYIKLRKFAPMGNALTFPVQTVVYAVITVACTLIEAYDRPQARVGESLDGYSDTNLMDLQSALKHLGDGYSPERWNTPALRKAIQATCRSMQVFGDDIICPTFAYASVVQVLTYLGLKVNTDKSYSEGFFREACGVDAYKGFDVTPTYVYGPANETSPESVLSLIACSNNLYLGGLWEACSYVTGLIPDRYRKHLPVVRYDSGHLGLVSFCGSQTRLNIKWDPDLQLETIRTLVPESISETVPAEDAVALLQYFTEAAPKVDSLSFLDPPIRRKLGTLLRSKTKLRLRGVPIRDLT